MAAGKSIIPDPIMCRKRVYFIGDVHLGIRDAPRSGAEQERALTAFLRAIRDDAETLYIVGDLFEFWFEYRTVVPTLGARVLFELYALVQAGVRVVCLPGNHDIWLGPYLAEQVGLKLPGGPITVTHQGLTLHIAHGDEFRTDWKFRISRAVLKNKICIALFRLLHPDVGACLACLVSRISASFILSRSVSSPDICLSAAKAKIAEGVDIVLCGHYHRPLLKTLDGGTLVVLGDWVSADVYAVLENGKIELKKWEWKDAL